MMRDYSPHSSAVPTAFSPDVSASGGHTSPGWETTDPNHRLQSELAASIEKRRLQSVNAGFQSLLSILPQQEGEKMSKVVADPNAFDDFGDPNQSDNELAPPYNIYIPPRTHGGKRKKAKNRRRHSETIWTIVSEQEHLQSLQNPHYATTTKEEPAKHKTHKSKTTTKEKEPQDKAEKKNKTKKKSREEHTSSFLENPIFHTDLTNWTLPRVELWCRDPKCQINSQLWRDFHKSRPTHLSQLQVQELLNQHHQFAHQQQQQVYYHYQPLQPPVLSPQVAYHHQQRSRFLADTSLPPDLPAPSSLSRKQRLTKIAQIFDDTDGAPNPNQVSVHVSKPRRSDPGCNNPYHQQFLQTSAEEESYYSPQYGNMHINMTIGAMNNLSSHLSNPHSHNPDSGMGTPSPTTPNSSKAINLATSLPQSSGGSSSAKTASTMVGTSSTEEAVSKGKSPRRVHETPVPREGKMPDRDTYSSTSSSSSSSGDVSSGSTFVTGFDSSESRGSSGPPSLNKPPHHSLVEPSNSNTKSNSHHHNHHRSSKSYADNVPTSTAVSVTATSGYPSVPHIPTGCRKTGICPSCNGLVPPPPSTTNHHLIPVDPLLCASGLGGPADSTLLPHHHNPSSHQYHHNITSASAANANKSDNALWNFSKFQHPLQRDHSFHSVGGFTLNGQYNTQVKKRCIVKFCSSHKIALVVSTFSLLVTIGLIITLILMKKRGMMDTMDMMPT